MILHNEILEQFEGNIQVRVEVPQEPSLLNVRDRIDSQRSDGRPKEVLNSRFVQPAGKQ